MAQLVQEHTEALASAKYFIAHPGEASESAIDSMRATERRIESYLQMEQAEYDAIVAKQRSFIRRMSSSEPLL